MNNTLFASVGFSVCSLFFTIFIFLMYLNKKKYKNIENTLFVILLILLVVLIVNELAYVLLLHIYQLPIAIDNLKTPLLIQIVCKLYLTLTIVWILVFTFYILALATRKRINEEEKKASRKRIAISLAIFGLIAIIASNCLNLEFYNYTDKNLIIEEKNEYSKETTKTMCTEIEYTKKLKNKENVKKIGEYSYINHLYTFAGQAIYVVYGIAVIALIALFYAFIYRNNLVNKSQKKSIIYSFVLVLVTITVQVLVDGADYNFQNFQLTLLLMTLFFTLENQDNKLLTEHEESKKKAEEANKEKTDFLTSISHEIRTPMNTIMGYSDVILREKNITKEEVNSDVTNVHTAAVNLLELINNILDMSRVESEKETVVNKEYNTQDLIIEINDLMNSKIDPELIKFNIYVDQKLPKKLSGDYTKVIKIISNILINVLNYTKKGTIELKMTQFWKESSFMLNAVVTSEHSEIPEEEFLKYYTNNNESDNRISTAILGVNVAKMYANMLNGKVEMTSKARCNIAYNIEIEESIIDQNIIGDISSLLSSKHNYEAIDLKGKKILVVDDNALNIKLLMRLLSSYNVTLDSANSGKECIEKCKVNKYDIIFLDHMMPEMDGIETLNELKKINPNLPPTIALTANAYTGVKEFYISQGFTDYLAKPINKNELNKLLIQLLKK